MTRLIYADTNSYGVFHRGFNSSSLAMFSEIYNEVLYIATPSSIKVVEKDFGGCFPSNVIIKQIWINTPVGKLSNYIHYILQFINSIFILLSAKKDDIIYFNFCPLLALPLINLLAKISKKKVLIMWHNDLSVLDDNNPFTLNTFSMRILSNLKAENYRWADSLFFCCLGEHIKKNISIFLSENSKKKMLSFEHTWMFSKPAPNIENIDKKDIYVGFIGSIQKERWLNSIIEFRKKISDKFKVFVIGRVFCDPKILIESEINFISGAEHKFIDDKKMKQVIDQMDFTIFLYPLNSYKLSASGSVYDAIDSEKYILALRNDCFDYLFNNRAEVGKLFNSFDEMLNYIQHITQSSIPSLDYVHIKERLSPYYEAKFFKKELIQIGFIK